MLIQIQETIMGWCGPKWMLPFHGALKSAVSQEWIYKLSSCFAY